MVIKKWKKLTRELLFSHPRGSYFEDKVKLPNNEVVAYLIEKPRPLHGVSVIALDSKNQILIQREYSYPPDDIFYQLPGGGIEEGETVLEAANRELAEESGYIGRHMEIIGSFYTNYRRSRAQIYVVACRNLDVCPIRPDKEEFIQSEWMTSCEIDVIINSSSAISNNFLAALAMYNHSESTN